MRMYMVHVHKYKKSFSVSILAWGILAWLDLIQGVTVFLVICCLVNTLDKGFWKKRGKWALMYSNPVPGHLLYVILKLIIIERCRNYYPILLMRLREVSFLPKIWVSMEQTWNLNPGLPASMLYHITLPIRKARLYLWKILSDFLFKFTIPSKVQTNRSDSDQLSGEWRSCVSYLEVRRL